MLRMFCEAAASSSYLTFQLIFPQRQKLTAHCDVCAVVLGLQLGENCILSRFLSFEVISWGHNDSRSELTLLLSPQSV